MEAIPRLFIIFFSQALLLDAFSCKTEGNLLPEALIMQQMMLVSTTESYFLYEVYWEVI